MISIRTLLACLLFSVALPAQGRYDPGVLPKGREYFELRDGLANAHRTFTRDKRGRVAFLGGSITAGGGWRDHTIRYLQQTFPDTTFEFISAGIPSMGSVPHAFRLERDVLAKGPVDLLFVEAAVNDSTNTSDPAHMRRGMEGVVRHARTVNPLTDIVHLHFVMPEHMADYRNGRVPASITEHEKVAATYGNPSLHLSREVTERIDAGQFEFSIDGSTFHVVDTFTQWSPGLHLPWAVILDDGLAPGWHEVIVRIAEGHDPRSTGTALRVFQLLLN